MGKGDARRETQIDDGVFAHGWCKTFGHKMSEWTDACINCGRSAQQISEQAELFTLPTRRQ